MELEFDKLEKYLSTRNIAPVTIEELRKMGGVETGDDALKQFGYGRKNSTNKKAGTAISGCGRLLNMLHNDALTKYLQL